MKTRICLAVLGLASITAAAQAYFAEQDDEPNQESRESHFSNLTDAEKRALFRRIDGTVREWGVLESADTIEFASRVPGPRTILNVVPEGRVKKGQLLIELDASDLRESLLTQRIAVEQARAALQSAEASLAGHTQEETEAVAAAELAVKVARLARDGYLAEGGELEVQTKSIESDLAVAQQQLKTAETALSRADDDVGRERARLAALEANAAIENARGRKQLLAEHNRPYQTAAFELRVLEKKAALARMKNASRTARNEAEADQRTHKATLELAEQKLKDVEKQVAACRIHAPRDGVVIHAPTESRRTEPAVIEPGGTVREAQPLLRIVDLSRLQVRVRVHESRIARVRKGQRAVVTFDALPERTFAGMVASVGDKAEPGVWPDFDRRDYIVLVQLEEPTADLRLGLTALAEIDVGKSKDE